MARRPAFAALLAVAIIGAVTTLGGTLKSTFTNLNAKMTPASTATGE